MERLDQGYLHPKREVPGLTCPGGESTPGPSAVGGEHSRKEPFEQLVNGYDRTGGAVDRNGGALTGLVAH
jgi:hypothetical protein